MTYSSTMHQRRANSYRAPYRRNQTITMPNSSKYRMGPVSNAVILILLSCLIGLLYLTQVTKMTSLGYKLEGLRSREHQLKVEYDDLTVAQARMQALDRVKNSAVASAMPTVAPSGTVSN